jgi:membrane fusion protein, copper/silver efflux system
MQISICRKAIPLGLLLAFALGGCSQPKTETLQAGDLQVQVGISPDPPTTGENHLLLSIRDVQGSPVDGAIIDSVYSMPAMGSMPEMKGGGQAHAKGDGKYEVAYPLAMLGDWTLAVRIQAPGHPPVEIRMKVAPPHNGFSIERRGAASGDRGAASAAPDGGALLDVSPERQQLIGVTYATVERRPLSLALRSTGRVEVDESQLSDVTLKYEAYVEKLYVSQTGQAVKKGEPLLTLYSPDLLAAEQDLLVARRNLAAGTTGSVELAKAAEERLRLWSLSAEQFKRLEQRGSAEPHVTIFSPASGVVLEKNVIEGTRAMAGTTLYRIGNLGRIWVIAQMDESSAPHLAVGQPATMSVPAFSGKTWLGQVSFIYPTVDEKTRSVRARLAFENPGLLIKPGMFVDVTIEVPLGIRLAAPDSALLASGEHWYAFVERAAGKLQPVEVQVGALAGDFREVRAGLGEGDRVATGATFLLSSEAQLRSALPRWSAP